MDEHADTGLSEPANPLSRKVVRRRQVFVRN